MDFKENVYEELNLYSNFSKASTLFPETCISFDEPLIGFPELGLKTTYQDATKAIMKQATRLSNHGVKKGDHVVIYKSPKIDTYFLAVAVSYLGAVPIMVSYHLPTSTMTIMCARLENAWLIFDSVTKKRATAIDSVQTNHLIELEKLTTQSINDFASQDYLPVNSISYMTHTSGTTGIPKLIAHSAQSMGWRTKWQKNVFDLLPEKKLVAFHISPVHSRFNIGIASLMSKGFPLLSISNGELDAVTSTLETYKPYALETHPNNFVQWSQLAVEKPELFASCHYFHSTFDAINKGTMQLFLNASLADKPVFMQVYGQSECGPMIMRFHTKESITELNARNMGVGMPGLTDVRIVDQKANVLPPNTNGNIQMLSKGRALTYYQEDQRFQENTDDLWWDSGDFGYKDEEGNLFLLDRQVDLINDVDSTLLIEDSLLDRLEFLDEVVVVRGKENVAQPIISIKKGTKMDWKRWWQAIADFPLLKEPYIWDYDAFPRTATMKVQRLKIEEDLKKA